MRYNSKTTPVLEKRLLTFIAGNGENYKRYLTWCDENEIIETRRFTKLGYIVWIQKRRKELWGLRQELQEEARRSSIMTIENRMLVLENTVGMLVDRMETVNQKARLLMNDEDPDAVIKASRLVDTLSRTASTVKTVLQHIAEERGEWGTKPGSSETDRTRRVDAILDKIAEDMGLDSKLAPDEADAAEEPDEEA